jgi:hypothetical protein
VLGSTTRAARERHSCRAKTEPWPRSLGGPNLLPCRSAHRGHRRGKRGTLHVGIGIVYLTVVYEDVPGILGRLRRPRDGSPRTPLGAPSEASFWRLFPSLNITTQRDRWTTAATFKVTDDGVIVVCSLSWISIDRYRAR